MLPTNYNEVTGCAVRDDRPVLVKPLASPVSTIVQQQQLAQGVPPVQKRTYNALHHPLLGYVRLTGLCVCVLFRSLGCNGLSGLGEVGAFANVYLARGRAEDNTADGQ